MKRYRYKDEIKLYSYIYESIKNNRKIDNKEVENLFEYLEEDMKINVSVDAVFDAIGLTSTGKCKNISLNESLVNNGKKVNVYNVINEGVKVAKKKGKKTEECIKEGILGGLVGAITGATFGPAVGKAICDALGITRGVLYDLFTSKLVTGAICAKLGLRM